MTLNGVGTVQVDAGTLNLSGAVGGDAPEFIKTGAGTLVLGNANNTYTAKTTVKAGTLSIASDADLGATTRTLTLSGGTLETTASLTSARTIALGATAGVQVDGVTTATLSGTIDGGGGTVLTKTGTGTLVLSGTDTYGGATIAAGTLDLGKLSSAGGGAITFAGTQATPATLMLETAAQPGSGATFRNALTNFGANDELDLKGFTYSAADTVTLVGKTLTFTDKSNDASSGKTEKFTLAGTPGTAYYAHDAGPDGVRIDTVCFAGGTRIRVLREGRESDVAVEDLVVGDRVVTASGALRPITWLGHRDIDFAASPMPFETWPVRIRAGAFGVDADDNALPARELRLSPGHPVLVGSGSNEHLVPIMCLINGTTIERMPVDAVTYWHVELDEHDILLAEGLPAESFLDYGTRPWFGPDAEAHALANPDFVVPGLGARCRPVALDGLVVEAERRRLDAVFAMCLAAPCAWPDAGGWAIAT